MSIYVDKPGFFTIIQDLGRWGHQHRGVSVSEPMDQFSLRLGNVMLGNDENAAALEITMPDLLLTFHDPCCIVLTGADLGMTINDTPAKAWRVYAIEPGTTVEITEMRGDGCRSYLCISGGIDVPLVMGSRSTHTKARLGGLNGRALKEGDTLTLLAPPENWRKAEGFTCPPEYKTTRFRDDPLYAMDGPQVEAFSLEGIQTLYSKPYTVSDQIDRMGYRLEGPTIDRVASPDIVSDGIVFGSIQVPGSGMPIVMMADRQTTGGYTKIAVLSSWSVAQLAQKLPGETIRFERITEIEATEMLRRFEENMDAFRTLAIAHRKQ